MARSGGNIAIISVGWDPGMFSLNRVMSEAILPLGNTYTFWGEGISQGHSVALRRIDGVLDARQYTIPIDSALDAVRSGTNPELTARQKHRRECFVVAQEGADLARIEREIVTMPNYFADNDTTVHFVSAEELARDHSGMPHGGFVIRSGKTGLDFSDSKNSSGSGELTISENNQILEYSLKLDSNPEFTSSIMVAYARAAYRLSKEGVVGCKTIFDIPPSYISPKADEELRRDYL
jgi:diaminopimelate dehydrogenase